MLEETSNWMGDQPNEKTTTNKQKNNNNTKQKTTTNSNQLVSTPTGKHSYTSTKDFTQENSDCKNKTKKTSKKHKKEKQQQIHPTEKVNSKKQKQPNYHKKIIFLNEHHSDTDM